MKSESIPFFIPSRAAWPVLRASSSPVLGNGCVTPARLGFILPPVSYTNAKGCCLSLKSAAETADLKLTSLTQLVYCPSCPSPFTQLAAPPAWPAQSAPHLQPVPRSALPALLVSTRTTRDRSASPAPKASTSQAMDRPPAM